MENYAVNRLIKKRIEAEQKRKEFDSTPAGQKKLKEKKEEQDLIIKSKIAKRLKERQMDETLSQDERDSAKKRLDILRQSK